MRLYIRVILFFVVICNVICLCECKGERNDKCELGRFFKLILGCVVNCVNKEEYIGRIMLMEEFV